MSTFPVTRMRRLRRSDRLRALVRETRLDLDDFVLPLFVGPATEPNPTAPPTATTPPPAAPPTATPTAPPPADANK